MVIGLKQNTKEENKTLRFFQAVFIPALDLQNKVQGSPLRGVAGTQLRRGLLQGATLPQDEGSSSEEQSSPGNVQADIIKRLYRLTVPTQGLLSSYT